MGSYPPPWGIVNKWGKSLFSTALLMLLVSSAGAGEDGATNADKVSPFSFTAGSVVTSNLYSLNITESGNTPAEKTPTSHYWFDRIAFSDSYLQGRVDVPYFGIQFRVNAPKLHSSTVFDPYHIFRETYGYALLGDFARIQLGLFEKTRLDALNTVVDEWSYGYIFRPGGASGETGGVVRTDLLQNFIAEFYAGPVTIEFSPLLIKKVTASDNYQNEFQNYNSFLWQLSGAAEHELNVAGALRVSGDVMDAARLQMLVGVGYDKDLELERPSTQDAVDESTIDGIFSLGADTRVIPDAALTAMVSGAFAYSWNEWESPTKSTGDKIFKDLYLAADVRAQYGGVPDLTVETHLKFSFGKFIDKSDTEPDGKNLFQFKIAAGAAYNITPRFQVRLVVPMEYSQATLRNDKDNAIFWEIRPMARWYLGEKAYLQAGISYANRQGWGYDGSQNMSREDTRVHTFSIPVKLCLEL